MSFDKCPKCGYIGEMELVWDSFVDEDGNYDDEVVGNSCPKCGYDDY